MNEPVVCSKCAFVIVADQFGRLPAECPQCGQMLIVDDQAEIQQPQEPIETELEEAKIRRIVRERRAQVRTRSYYLVVVLACIVLAVQLALRLYSSLRAGNVRGSVGWLAGSVLLLAIAWLLVTRVRELTREINTSALPKSQAPPDFGRLSDGSQHRRNLERLNDE